MPTKLQRLRDGEAHFRRVAEGLIAADRRLILHQEMIEQAMDVADALRQCPTDDEDLKAIQILGMRTFNAFGASVALMMSGYIQNSTLVMRDILEVVFLLDYFRTEPTAIKRWRTAPKKDHRREFKPVKIREALDARDGFSGQHRRKMYETFCELAAHPTMKSVLMMRPTKDGNALIGPFIEPSSFASVLSEAGRLAAQAGEQLEDYLPKQIERARTVRMAFSQVKLEWLAEFYPRSPGA